MTIIINVCIKNWKIKQKKNKNMPESEKIKNKWKIQVHTHTHISFDLFFFLYITVKKIETFHHRQRLSTTTTAEAVEIIGIKLDQIRWSKCKKKLNIFFHHHHGKYLQFESKIFFSDFQLFIVCCTDNDWLKIYYEKK